MAGDRWSSGPGPPGATRSVRLRLVRATNVRLGTDPTLADLYRARFEGAPPRVRARGGLVSIEYGPRFRPSEWGRQACELVLNPAVGWRLEAPRGIAGLRADLRGARLLGMEVDHGVGDAELTLARPSGSVALRFAGASDFTIHRPAGAAARLQVAAGASRVSFDGQHYGAVGGEGAWASAEFEEATDRYEISFARGVRDLVVDTVQPPAAAAAAGRRLATVLFTDIVGSTERAAALGDRRWRELLDDHDRAARRLVERDGGRVVKRTGDGILATFDSPGRAVACALALRAELGEQGIAIRAGLHTGEVELRDDDVGGIAVHLASRVMAAAAPGEVLVSRTVRDLVAGSDLALEDRGSHALKGLPDRWQLFAAG